MTNPYQVPLEITVHTSCDCFSAVPQPTVLGPGEKGSLIVTMDSRRFAGSEIGTISVHVAGTNWYSNGELKVLAESR